MRTMRRSRRVTASSGPSSDSAYAYVLGSGDPSSICLRYIAPVDVTRNMCVTPGSMRNLIASSAVGTSCTEYTLLCPLGLNCICWRNWFCCIACCASIWFLW